MYSTLVIMASALFALLCRLRTPFPPGRFAQLVESWVLLAVAVELVGGVLNLAGWKNNDLYIVFCAVEFVLLTFIASAARGTTSKWTGPVIGVFLAGWLLEFASIWGQNKFVIYSLMAGAFWLVGLYLLRLWELVNTWSGDLRNAPQFWLCLVVLLYFGAAAPLIGTVNYFNGVDPPLAKRLYFGVRVLCVIKFILMGITCLRMRPTPLADERTG
ncbi:MAG: hypothetical protein JNL43_10915 [Flavobacteriales bacterium]|nr:hypothetical protein [Flavobacteriales bacterium]